MNAKLLFFSYCLLAGLHAAAQQQNLALHKPVAVTSQAPGSTAANIVDGKISRHARWEAANGKAPHIIEIDLKKYYNINELRIHTGIADAEKRPDETTQAAGFWSMKNFKMQYWDDANWSDFPKSELHENRLVTVVFKYSPTVTTYKIRLVCDDGEPVNVMEIEAFGTPAANMPEPPAAASSLQVQEVSTAPRQANITVSNKISGASLQYVGYNQGYYMPGSNVSGWVEYSQVNSFRVWATMNAFVPEKSVQVDKTLHSAEEFDKRKAELRANPEHNRFIKWEQLLPLYDLPDSSSTNAMVFNYALTELKRLGVDVVLQMGSRDFEDNWENKWKQWQRYYALAYHAARKGNVAMFAMQNEPNHRNSGPMKLDQWIMGMQIVSDAIHAAVNDVNKKYGTRLVPKFVGPVTAGQNTDWWAGVARAIRTDYHGKKVEKDLLEIFSTHSYNSPAVGYTSRINNIRSIIQENHPAGDPLPIAYTEIGRWMNAYLIDKEETMDSPSLFTEWAGIYTNNMKNGGYGMWAFKFANTASGPYPRGIKSGHHFIWQGRRIVEDAYRNLALNRPVRSSGGHATAVTDGNKSNQSAWTSDSTAAEKWLEIDLGTPQTLGSAVIYTGSDGGVYTAPDRIRNFKLQYATANGWKDIAGTAEENNKYAQVYSTFTQPVTTSKVRFFSTDKGSLTVREIKLFAAGDGPSSEPDYNVSGIQRTGEVVRLFAKGFRGGIPLYETTASVDDSGLDACTAYDEKTGNYYIWLVQRGPFEYRLQLDVSALGIATSTPVVAETVNAGKYGEASLLNPLAPSKKIEVTLPPQTVMLLTIPKHANTARTLKAAAEAGISMQAGSSRQLQVQLDAATPSNNRVTYLRFNLAGQNVSQASRVLLRVNGRSSDNGRPFRLHVYGIPNSKWNAASLNWQNAPLLNRKEALVAEVGRKAFVAGELAFTGTAADHWLDVTELVKKHAASDITFVLVRETRQLGDDEDKGRRVIVTPGSAEIFIWGK